MNAINYDKLMTEQIKSADKNSRLLLHCCCAPCSSACLERLKDYFKITVLFYDPNIEDAEYARRKSELERFIALTGCADITECDRDTAEFDRAVKGLEDQPEGGRRCAECFKLRLSKTAEIAERGNYDFFCDDAYDKPAEKRRAYQRHRRKVARRQAREMAVFRL